MSQDLMAIKEELIVFLRNSDIISTSNRGVTTKTDTGTFNNDSTYTLSTSPTLVKNVRSVTIDGQLKTRYTDYTVNYSTGVITFTVAQSGDYSIVFDYGNTDSLYPDFPQANLKLSAFPRVAVDIIGGNISDVDLGANSTLHIYNITVVCYNTDTKDLEDMISAVQTAMLSNKKSFYYLKYIKPDILGPIVNFPQGGNKVLSRAIDFVSTFNYQ